MNTESDSLSSRACVTKIITEAMNPKLDIGNPADRGTWPTILGLVAEMGELLLNALVLCTNVTER